MWAHRLRGVEICGDKLRIKWVQSKTSFLTAETKATLNLLYPAEGYFQLSPISKSNWKYDTDSKAPRYFPCHT